MPTTKAAAKPDQGFLSPAEFAQLTGLSMATVRRYLRDGRVPKIQPGGARCRVLIPRAALELHLCPSTESDESIGLPAAEIRDDSNRDKRRHGPAPRWTGRR